MKKLYYGYFTAISPTGKTLGRFINAADALKALPSTLRCFGNAIPIGTIYKIEKETIAFTQKYYDCAVSVFESFDEYLAYTKSQQNQKEKENEIL